MTMNENMFNSMVTLNSRVQPAMPRKFYYEFTASELQTLIESVVKQCMDIADQNHEHYTKYGETLAGLVLPNSADLIAQHFEMTV